MISLLYALDFESDGSPTCYREVVLTSSKCDYLTLTCLFHLHMP